MVDVGVGGTEREARDEKKMRKSYMSSNILDGLNSKGLFLSIHID